MVCLMRSMENSLIDCEEVSCMFLKGKKMITTDEQLASFMHRFNLDRETVESMPAFEEHCKFLFKQEIKK